MSTRVAINGLGTIGRAILKGLIDEPVLEIVAVNDLADVANLGYLLRFDTVYGRHSKPVTIGGDLVNIMSWHGNKWSYANQMLRAALSRRARTDSLTSRRTDNER